MLAEMQRFLQVHQGRSNRATPTEALHRATLAPAKILGLEQSIGHLENDYPASFIEVEPVIPVALRGASADDAIRAILPLNSDHPGMTVNRVTLAGQTVFERAAIHA
jgi:cytosine/adenosine deaminase-related metal-dependent hydrolase